MRKKPSTIGCGPLRSKGSQTQTAVGLDCLARHTTMADLLFIIHVYNIMCSTNV